jgi:glycosyltransferase involved in cell wall biosynthesis
LKVLVELRSALDGHAGIPQEARLLFQGLGQLAGVEVQGLIQSSDRFLPEGLAGDESGARPGLPAHEQIDRLSRVVVALQPAAAAPRRFVTRALGKIGRLAKTAALLARTLTRRRETLGWFDATNFRDFVWRSLFAKTLPPSDFEQVTRAKFRIARAAYGYMHACGLLTRHFGRAAYPRLDTRGIDAMLTLTPYPATVDPGTTLIVRYCDAVPLLMPHTIINKARHQALHYQALCSNVASGAYFVCNSDATRRELLAVFPEVEARAVTIPPILSHHYFLEDSSPARVREVLARRLNQTVHTPAQASALMDDGLRKADAADAREASDVQYLLMVSTLEPRKNHLTLVEAWEQLRSNGHPQLKLVLVGSLGWDYKAIVERIRLWVERGDVLLLLGVPADELRLLYRHARATVCPSFAEGFGYAGAEAMRCGGVVVASDLPVHHEVYGDAAEYFDAYSVPEAASAVSRVIGRDGFDRRRELIAAGVAVSDRYLPERVLPQWGALLAGLSL